MIELAGLKVLQSILGIFTLFFKNLFCHIKKTDNNITNKDKKIYRESINYHFTRQCNYSCKFCFHTAKTSFVLDEETAKKGLKLLSESGMKKINFSGGEPFTKPVFLGNLVKYCKEQLNLESVTIVSNGSMIDEKWFQNYGSYLDILAISCDSFNESVLNDIGRKANKKVHISQMYKIRDWCKQYNVLFKINTVVTSKQFNEDMNIYIEQLQPYRWKVFQCLLIEGENIGINALRNAQDLVVSKAQFDSFIQLHKQNNPVPEDNTDMKDSYLLLDEYMRFLNCRNGKKEPSKSILDVGVDAALDESGFDEAAFFRRGGKFKWSKGATQFDW